MTLRSTLLSNKSAASNAIINEAKTRYSKNPKFPQDEAGVKALFEALDTAMPKEALTVTAGKQLYLWLLKQLYLNNAAADPLEDLPERRPLLAAFWKATRPGGRLQGDAGNINNYRDFEDLREALEDKKKPSGGAVEDSDRYTPEEMAEIEKGAKKIYDQGGISVWKVPQTSDTWIKNNTGGDNASKLGVFRAAYLLCSNKRNEPVSWCVGWDTGTKTSLAANYIPEGDFFVFKENGWSIYALSTQKGRSLKIWNQADTPIFMIGEGFGEGGSAKEFPSLAAGAKAAGVPLELGGISALPEIIIPALKAIRKTEPAIQMIPEGQLTTQVDKTPLYKILHYTKPIDFVKDLNRNYSNRASYILTHALVAAAVSDAVHMPFDEAAFREMNLYALNGYLECLAPLMDRDARRIPEELDKVLFPLCEDWLLKG